MLMALQINGFTDLLSGGSVEGLLAVGAATEDFDMHMALHVNG